MVFPLYDENPFKWPVPPFATWGLIAVNVIVFLMESSNSSEALVMMMTTYGTTPAALFHNTPYVGGVPPEATLVTSMFLHNGWQHLLGNMVYLWVFGDDIEEVLGPFRFLAFYFMAGIATALIYSAANTQSMVPLIGTSGAIFGVLAAYLLLRPCSKVFVFVWRFPVSLRAYWVIGGWAALQVYLLSVESNSHVAYMSHVGGLVAGAFLFLALRPAGVQLFECIEHPDQTLGYWRKKPVPVGSGGATPGKTGQG